jgi:acetylornithine deacetylase
MSLDKTAKEQIREAVSVGFAAQTAYLTDLVRFPSTRGNEHTIQDYMARAMRERGLKVDVFDIDRQAITRHPGGSRISAKHSTAPMVVGIHRPKEQKGRSLTLQGHVDVVPPGPLDMWSSPPFEPVVREGWMYGRGAGDMKAGVSAAVFALDALRQAGFDPAGTVYLQSAVEEESTGNGALMGHLRGYRSDAVLIPEPGREMLTRANVGVLWFEIEVRGHPVHVAYMGKGVNAIDAVYRVIGALRKVETRWNEAARNDPLFGKSEHPLNLNVGRIEGGDWASSVPAWCRIECRMAILPGTSPGQAAREIEEAVGEFARSDNFLANNPPRITWNGFFAEGYRLEPGSEAEAVLGRAHERVAGKPLEASLATAYLDARVYSLYEGIPALNYGCLAENYHGFDERVNLESLKRTTEVIALFIAEWCGLEPRS